MRYEFARDRLRAAVLVLALEDDPLQERLALAYAGELRRVVAEDVPFDLRQRLEAVQRTMAVDEITLLDMEEGWARRVAAEIVELYVAVLGLAG